MQAFRLINRNFTSLQVKEQLMINLLTILFTTLALTLTTYGCGSGEPVETTTPGSGPTSGPDSKFIMTSEPVGAVPVGEARTSVKDKDEIVLVGRIGGSVKPFVDGVAAFTIVDSKVPYCAKEEGCPTPWDYCCEQNQVKDNIAMVKIVDADGNPVTKDARELLGVKELTTVVIHGKAKRDADGNLTVNADQVFVKEHLDVNNDAGNGEAHAHDHDHGHSHD